MRLIDEEEAEDSALTPGDELKEEEGGWGLRDPFPFRSQQDSQPLDTPPYLNPEPLLPPTSAYVPLCRRLCSTISPLLFLPSPPVLAH